MNHPFPPQGPPHGPPPPPPAPMPHAPFTAMGPDPRMHMEPPVEDFRAFNIQTVEPRFDEARLDERPLRAGRGPVSRRTAAGTTKRPVYYEGYIFTKVKAEQPWQKQTWASVKRTAMPVSQAELREKAAPKLSLFSREKSVLEQYGSLTDYQQRQVDRLIKDRERADDPDFKYQLASIKVEQRNVRGSKPQVSLIVIIRRQPGPGVPMHPDMVVTPAPGPASEIVDLTGQEDSERSSMNSFGSFSPPPHQQHGPHPFDRHHSEPWGHGPHVMDDRFMPMPHGPPFGEEQVPRRHPDVPTHGFNIEEFHEGHGGHGDHGGHDAKGKTEDHKDKREKAEKPDKRDKHEKHEKQDQNAKHSQKGKHDKRPEVHHSSSHKSVRKDHRHSDTLSSDSDWDHLSGHSEDTFETVPTSSSGGSKTYKKIYVKEKKHGKDERRKSSSHQSSRDRGAERPIYREHTRKVPEKQREPSPVSPAPSRRSGRSSGHYAVEEDVFIQPEISHRGEREPRRESRPRQVSYPRERPRRQQRAMSYDEEALFDFDPEEPRSPHYVKKVTRLPRAPPVDYEKERLKLEVERERREKEYLGEELDRTHAELKRASRMPPPRERPPPRAMRPPPIIERPIIEREPPYPRPRRVQEQFYEDYEDYDPRYY